MKLIESKIYNVGFTLPDGKAVAMVKAVKANTVQEALNIGLEYVKDKRYRVSSVQEVLNGGILESSTKTITIDL